MAATQAGCVDALPKPMGPAVNNCGASWIGSAGNHDCEHVAYRLRERGAILQPEVEHDEVLAALDLCNQPIRRRHFGDRLINLARIQPGQRFLIDILGEPRDAAPYSTPPFPPPGPHGP